MLQEQHEYRFTGIFIPADIFLDKELTAIDKILWAEIDALSKNKTGCFATNEYLSNVLHVSLNTIKRSIKTLITNGLVESSTDYNTISGRRLFAVNKTSPKMSHQNDGQPKNEPPPSPKMSHPPQPKNEPHSIISTLRESNEYNRLDTHPDITASNEAENTHDTKTKSVTTNHQRLLVTNPKKVTSIHIATNPLSPPNSARPPALSKPKTKPYGEYKSVHLTDEQYAKLIDAYREHDVQAMIRKLDKYCAAKGRRYKNYPAVLTDWVADSLNIKPRDKYHCLKCKKPYNDPRGAELCCATPEYREMYEARYGK